MAANQQIVTSESEEMYLITIARAVEDGHSGPVPIPRLAAALDVSQVAANEMIKKLHGRGLVDYLPYKGATLTNTGHSIAQGVLRRRRLWGVFLTEHLGLSPADADEAACEFEHVTPGHVESRLAEFLGEPLVGPQGRKIPRSSASSTQRNGRLISEVELGVRSRVVRVDASPAIVAFLAAEGIILGAEVVLEGRGEDGKVLLAVAGAHVEVTADVSAAIVVEG